LRTFIQVVVVVVVGTDDWGVTSTSNDKGPQYEHAAIFCLIKLFLDSSSHAVPVVRVLDGIQPALTGLFWVVEVFLCAMGNKVGVL